MLSKQAIEEFQKIYLSEYGEELTFEQAAIKAESFLRFYKAIVKTSTTKGSHNESINHP